jgi:hypothetical protein
VSFAAVQAANSCAIALLTLGRSAMRNRCDITPRIRARSTPSALIQERCRNVGKMRFAELTAEEVRVRRPDAA